MRRALQNNRKVRLMPILQQNGSYCFNSISCTLQTALKEIDIDSINKNGGCESDNMKDRLGTN